MEQQNNPDLPTDHLHLPQEASEVTRESDRESCASARTQDSLELLDEKTSDMRGSQRDLRSLASPEPEEQQEQEASEEREGYLGALPEVTLDDCKGRPPPPDHLKEQQELIETSDVGVTVTDCDNHEQGITNVGADIPQHGYQEPPLHFQEHPEVDTGGQDSQHIQSHDHQLQEVPADEDAGEDHPVLTDDNNPKQGSEVLSVSVEAAPYQINEPVAMVSVSIRSYVSEEKCHLQICWTGKIVSQDGVLELEGGSGRSVRYPPLKRTMSTDPNSVQAAASSELDPGTLAVDVGEETSAVPSNDGLTPSTERRFSDEERLGPLVAEACPTTAAEEGQLGVSTSVEEKNSSGVVVLKQDWRVQTVNDGTAFRCDWSSSMLLKPHSVLRIRGAAMV